MRWYKAERWPESRYGGEYVFCFIFDIGNGHEHIGVNVCYDEIENYPPNIFEIWRIGKDHLMNVPWWKWIDKPKQST